MNKQEIEWISVEDELPRKGIVNHRSKCVLAYISEIKCQFTACYNHDLEIWESFNNSPCSQLNGVTYWTHLLRPPVTEGE